MFLNLEMDLLIKSMFGSQGRENVNDDSKEQGSS